MDFLSKERFDRFWVGSVLGIVGAAIGFVGFGLIWAIGTDQTFDYYIQDLFTGVTSFFQDKVVTISILLDVVLFYLFMRIGWYNVCKGLLAIVILAVPVALWLY